MNTKDNVLWLVVAVWFVGAAYGIWYFEVRFQRPFVSQAHATLFESGSDAPAAEDWFKRSFAGRNTHDTGLDATVVHFYDADCPCNRFTEPHLAQIQARYARRRVNFVRVERSSVAAAGSPRWIEATPAAMVFDAHGKLAYFGPYSDAAACGTSNGLVERALDQVLSGKSLLPRLVVSGGCFCAVKPQTVFGIRL